MGLPIGVIARKADRRVQSGDRSLVSHNARRLARREIAASILRCKTNVAGKAPSPMNSPASTTIRAAVDAQRAQVAALFEQLRQDGLDEPGVSRDPYGPGEQRAHATVMQTAETLGLEI